MIALFCSHKTLASLSSSTHTDDDIFTIIRAQNVNKARGYDESSVRTIKKWDEVVI